MKRALLFLLIATIVGGAVGSLLTANQAQAETMRLAQTTVRASAGNSFTYQGRLDDAAGPVTGAFEFELALYDDLVAGQQVATAITRTTPVTDGMFSLSLDFGPVFNDTALFLAMRVRPAGGGAFAQLQPRQPLAAVPFALFANKVRPVANVVVVARSGGDYPTINAALAAIDDASAGNPYLIRVAPGLYLETILLKSYVSIEGSGQGVTIVQGWGGSTSPATDGSSATLRAAGDIVADVRSLTVASSGLAKNYAVAIWTEGGGDRLTFSQVTANSAGAVNNTAVYNLHGYPTFDQVTARSSGGLNSFGFYNNDATVTLNQAAISSLNGSINSIGVFNYAGASATAWNTTINGVSSIFNQGAGSSATVYDSILDGAVSAGTLCLDSRDGSGKALSSGCQSLASGAVAWADVSNVPADLADGDDVADADASPTNELQNLSLAGTTLSLSRDATPVDLSPFAGANPGNVVWVASSGGDYTSVSAALASISDASAENQYLIKVAPGIFTETTGITLTAYVDVEGSGEGVTVLRGLGSDAAPEVGASATVHASGNITAELRFLTIEANGAGRQIATPFWSGNSTEALRLFHVTLIAANADRGQGLFNYFSSPALSAVTIEATSNGDNYGVYNYESSSPTLSDVTITAGSATGDGFGVFYDGPNSSIVDIRHSRISGTTNSLRQDSNDHVFNVVGSQLEGLAWAGDLNTFHCLGAYDGDYAPLDANCQAQPADGTALAAVYARCSDTDATVLHGFHRGLHWEQPMWALNGSAAGHCTIEFNVDISNRVWVATARHGTLGNIGVTCNQASASQLACQRWDLAGNGVNGEIMVIVQ